MSEKGPRFTIQGDVSGEGGEISIESFNCGTPECPGHKGPPWCGQTEEDVRRSEVDRKLLVHLAGALCILADEDDDTRRSTVAGELTCPLCRIFGGR